MCEALYRGAGTFGLGGVNGIDLVEDTDLHQ
jgi:hypothetical protein